MSFVEDVCTGRRGPGMFGGMLILFGVASTLGIGYHLIEEDVLGAGIPIHETVSQQEAEIAAQRQQIIRLEENVAHADENKRLSIQYAESIKQIAELKAKLVQISPRKTILEQEIAALERDAFKHRQRYREQVRTALVGATYDQIVTRNGKTFRKVVLNKAEADQIVVMHESGGARIAYADLPDDLQKLFVYDPNEKEPALPAKPQSESTAREKSEPSELEKQAKEAKERAEQVAKDIENANAEKDRSRLTSARKDYDKQASVVKRMEEELEKTRREYEMERNRVRYSGGVLNTPLHQKRIAAMEQRLSDERYRLENLKKSL